MKKVYRELALIIYPEIKTNPLPVGDQTVILHLREKNNLQTRHPRPVNPSDIVLLTLINSVYSNLE